MLIWRPIGSAQAPYYWHESGQGRWVGTGLRNLSATELTPRALASLLDGVDPATGEVLPTYRRVDRRPGWDLTLAAPKSISLLAALAPDAEANALRAAHTAAVDDTLGFVERRALWAHRGREGTVSSEVDGLVGAAFDHQWSSAHDPHLHTHVIVANLAPAPDSQWVALNEGALWPARKAISAAYQLSLRHHIDAVGLSVDWRLLPTGQAELAAVPPAALQAVSTRHRDIVVGVVPPTFGARAVGSRKARLLPESPTPWPERAAAAGLDAEAAHHVLRQGATVPARHAEPAHVAQWLADRASTFVPLDVLPALAATDPVGMPSALAEERAEAFAGWCLRAPGGRYMTRDAAERDERLSQVAIERQNGRCQVVFPRRVAEIVADTPGLGPGQQDQVEHLLSSGHGVDVLRAPSTRDGPLALQAQIIDAARQGWQVQGYRVAVLTEPRRAGRRWEALTSLPTWSAGELPDVLVVDRADRATAGHLLPLLEAADRSGCKVVLVAGGTLPPLLRPRCAALDQLPGPPPMAADGPGRPHAEAASVMVDRTRVVGSLGDALNSLGALGATPTVSGSAPVLVGFGPAEAAALNARVRAWRRTAGELAGPHFEADGRAYQQGDRVLAVRSGVARAGQMGLVVGVSPDAMRVDWGSGPVAVDRRGARTVSHGYATTPTYLDRVAAPIVLLGDPARLPAHRNRIREAVVIAPAHVRAYEPEILTAPSTGTELLASRAVADQAIDRRADLLAKAMELGGSPRWAAAGLGAPPQDGPSLERWRRAARAVAAYQERWPDRPGLGDRPVEQRLELARVQQLCRAISNDRSIGLA